MTFVWRETLFTESNQPGPLHTFGYDGYGRLSSRTTPEQGTTSYNYNLDDTTNFVTDARGAKTIFGYNPRHLVSSISYDLSNLVPGQSVAATPNVSNITYDPAGNRKTMNDGLGGVTYGYDNLSQLTSETRTFTGLGSFTFNYSYNLAGELASMTDQWAQTVNYGYDKVGRVTGVTASGGINPPAYATNLTYRAFGSIKGMSYGDGKSLNALYDNRMRPTRWDVWSVLGYNYNYDYFNEHTGRVTYAGSIYDPKLDRSYEYDHVGRLVISHSGQEARAHAYSGQWSPIDGPYSQGYDFDVWGNVTRKYGWGGEVQGGSGGNNGPDVIRSYTNNKVNGFSYDAAGNLTNDLGQTFTYDATGQQATAAYGGYSLQQSYDGNGLRVKKTENGVTTYYLRSSVLGGQVVAELNGGGVLQRNYVYLGGQLLTLKQSSNYYWVHEDPITKSKRVVDRNGTLVSTIELDPWGATVSNFSNNDAFQPKKFTSYERDVNGSDEAMSRRYNRWQSRFDQPDPYDGSYNAADPQSFNRYAYVQGDPVNVVDPTGLMSSDCQVMWEGWQRIMGTGIEEFGQFLPGCVGGFGGLRSDGNPRGGAGGGQEPKQIQDAVTPIDCLALVAEVRRIANSTNVYLAGPNGSDIIQSFMDQLASRFTEFTSATELGVALSYVGLDNTIDHGEFNDAGFKPAFQDHIGPGATDNQVRHTVGGLIAGYLFGSGPRSAGRAIMDSREDMKTPSGQADTRLNRVTMPMGEKIRGPNGASSAVGLADWIKKTICDRLFK